MGTPSAASDAGNRVWILWLAGIVVSIVSTVAVAFVSANGHATEKVEDRTVTQVERIAKLEATVAAQSTRLDSIDKQLDRVDKKLDRVLDKLAEAK